jgi:hypothetical protein
MAWGEGKMRRKKRQYDYCNMFPNNGLGTLPVVALCHRARKVRRRCRQVSLHSPPGQRRNLHLVRDFDTPLKDQQ